MSKEDVQEAQDRPFETAWNELYYEIAPMIQHATVDSEYHELYGTTPPSEKDKAILDILLCEMHSLVAQAKKVMDE